MKICPVGAESFHADWRTARQTDVTRLTVTSRNFMSTPKKQGQGQK
jgi:hypothetical protein